MRKLYVFWISLIGVLISATATFAENSDLQNVPARHGFALYGEPALAKGFRQFPFAFEGALKGGGVSLSASTFGETKGFDSLNPFIDTGSAYQAVRQLTFESLMLRSPDEPFTLYGQIARSIQVPEDLSWVAFNLDPGARFSDGTRLTIHDLAFSFETLKTKGASSWQKTLAQVTSAEMIGQTTIRFKLSPQADRGAIFRLAQMPVLSATYYAAHEFGEPSMDPPLGSGPYRIKKAVAGKSIEFERVPNYWAQSKGINKGRHNFNRITLLAPKDDAAEFNDFKSGRISIRREEDLIKWRHDYDFNAVRNALIIREVTDHQRGSGFYGFVFNTRRPLFADNRVRAALIKPFDFEWINSKYYEGTLRRQDSYFDNTPFASSGPATAAETSLLEPWAAFLDPEVFQKGWHAPVNGNRDNARANAVAAMALLNAAGWNVEDGSLKNATSLKTFEFEIITENAEQERLAQTYAASLKRFGIKVTVTLLEPAEFNTRLQQRDFDMAPFAWSSAPGGAATLAANWGSLAANQNDSQNIAGINNPAVDDLLTKLQSANSQSEYIHATRALDRLLLSGSYAVPLFNQPKDHMAWWSEIRRPNRAPLLGWGFEGADSPLATWWMTSDN